MLLQAAGIIGIHFLMGEGKKHKEFQRLLLVFLLVVVGLGQAYTDAFEYSQKYSAYILYTVGSGEGLSNIIFATPLFPFGFILRCIWGLISPFPGEIFLQDFRLYPLYSTLKLFVYSGVVLQIFMVPYLFKGIKKMDANALSAMLTYLMVVLITFGFRHFIFIYPFFAIEIYYGLKNTSRGRVLSYSIAIFMLVLVAGAIYIYIRH